MQRSEFDRVQDALDDATEGDGYHVRISLKGGHSITGAYYRPEKIAQIVRIDVTESNKTLPCFVEIDSISAIQLVP